MNKKSEMFRERKKSPSSINRINRREEERNTICPHGHPLLRCRPCRQELELKKHPDTIFIKGN